MLEGLLGILLGLALVWKVFLIVLVALWILVISFESNCGKEPRFYGKSISLMSLYLLFWGFGWVKPTPLFTTVLLVSYLTCGIIIVFHNWKNIYVPEYLEQKKSILSGIHKDYSNYLKEIEADNLQSKKSYVTPKTFDNWFRNHYRTSSIHFRIANESFYLPHLTFRDSFLKVSFIKNTLIEDSVFWIFDLLYHISRFFVSLATGAIDILRPYLEGISKKANEDFEKEYDQAQKQSETTAAEKEL
jgi:hypothetical protein